MGARRVRPGADELLQGLGALDNRVHGLQVLGQAEGHGLGAVVRDGRGRGQARGGALGGGRGRRGVGGAPQVCPPEEAVLREPHRQQGRRAHPLPPGGHVPWRAARVPAADAGQAPGVPLRLDVLRLPAAGRQRGVPDDLGCGRGGHHAGPQPGLPRRGRHPAEVRDDGNPGGAAHAHGLPHARHADALPDPRRRAQRHVALQPLRRGRGRLREDPDAEVRRGHVLHASGGGEGPHEELREPRLHALACGGHLL
mmetsp:Transcript_25847/g.80632  ORF Transcript_25847/g.80632 Transcript_25847/m.80632 type:complete len:254 (+) Transcript_25847:570-1331(+)